MLTGLGRFSAAVWSFVALWVFWLLTSVAFEGPALSTGETVKAWLYIGVAMGMCYGMHRITCWVLGGAARKPSHDIAG